MRDEQLWLEGLEVLDLSRLLPGPFCSLLLADMGADVLKIEEPRGGDYARWYPPFIGDVGAFFGAINRNKRSMTLNLKEPAGKDVLLRLAEKADVLIESFRPGVMDRLGLGYETLKALNPRLVYCSISGYGADGPLRERAGHDLNYMARCGLLDLNGRKDEDPVVAGFQVADVAGGALYAALGIVSALFKRERTGKGAFIDISMTEGALSLALPSMAIRAGGEAVGRGEGMLGGGVPAYDVYETADARYLAVAALEPKFWQGFVEVIGAPELATDGLLNGDAGHRARHRVAQILATRSREEWEQIFARVDVCVEGVKTLDEVLVDELFEARQVFFELQGIVQARTPVTPRQRHNVPAPELGADTEAVLESLGFDSQQIDSLRSMGVI
jgi:alpha-methylacyl-CoA racemase